MLLVLCGLLPNVVGTWLWLRRDRLAPYPALQALVATVFIFTALARGGLILCGRPLGVLPQCSAEAWRVSWILLIYPSLMLMFPFQDKQANTGLYKYPNSGQPLSSPAKTSSFPSEITQEKKGPP